MDEHLLRLSAESLCGTISGQTHILPIRIYYEDTDFSGAVYHASYVRFCERGRSDFLRHIGIFHHILFDQAPALRRGFVVRRLTLDYFKPATIDDLIEVHTVCAALGGASIRLHHTIWRGSDKLLAAHVTVALVDGHGRVQRLPGDMRAGLEPFVQQDAAGASQDQNA